MTSWITYARPFAKLRAGYRVSIMTHWGRGNSALASSCEFGVCVIDRLWGDFKAAMEEER